MKNPPADAAVIRHCPMCGFDFSEGDHPGCGACPLNQHCRVLCCPRCGYDFVEDSWVLRRWRDLKDLLGQRPPSAGKREPDGA